MPTVVTTDGNTSGPQVDYVRKEVERLRPIYERIDDCLLGQTQVKSKGEEYLPHPTPITVDMTPGEKEDATKRYKAYKQRALFYNLAGNTVKGLEGQLFLRNPAQDEEFPEVLDYLNFDIDGQASGIIQQSKQASNRVIRDGRVCLWTDYPKVTDEEGKVKEVSKADNESGEIRAVTTLIKAKHFINWRITKRGAKSVLSKVVFVRKYVSEDDGFELKLENEWVVLELNDAWQYSVTVYRKGNNIQFEIYSGPDYISGADGQILDHIPFDIIGAEDNNHLPNKPPIEDLVDINFAHYHNSADYEEACFILGQPTPWYSGLTETWVKEVFKGRVLLGSRRAVPLPENAQAGLLQATENTMIFEAMKHKEKQAKAIGAKMVEDREVQRTATEAKNDNVSENSELATIAKNVSETYAKIINRHARFMNMALIRENNSEAFVINTDFDVNNISAEDIRIWLELYEKTGITWEELRFKLRKAGIAIEDDEEAKVKIDKMLEDKQKAAMDLMQAKSSNFDNDDKKIDPKKDKKPAPKKGDNKA